MDQDLKIRPATSSDLDALLDLYLQLTPNNARFPLTVAEDILEKFMKFEGSAILIGEIGGELATSCALAVVPNLTRGGAPYALIENVITNESHRRQGLGRRILNAAANRACDHGCYKVMLMTGLSDPGTLAFYESAGFAQSKTGFQIRRIPPR